MAAAGGGFGKRRRLCPKSLRTRTLRSARFSPLSSVMTRRRIIEPGTVWALSRRTTRRHFLLNPDEARQMEQAYWYCLGYAAMAHGVRDLLLTHRQRRSDLLLFAGAGGAAVAGGSDEQNPQESSPLGWCLWSSTRTAVAFPSLAMSQLSEHQMRAEREQLRMS